MGMFHQGLAVYETFLEDQRSYSFVVEVRDFALFFLDGVFQTEVVRRSH